MSGLDINEVAQRSGMPASTLRFYEEKGLIASVGRRGLRRVFGPAVLERLAIPREKAILNIDRFGNTSSASVPVTLDEGVRSGRIRPGHLVAMMAIGAGMSWGGALVRW